MSKQILVVLFLAILASAGGWFVLNNQKTQQLQAGALFDGIEAYANELTEIVVENNLGLIVTAKRMTPVNNGRLGQTFPIEASEVEPQRWFIVNAANSEMSFAADQTKLSALASALVKARLVEPKTSQPAKHERLGLRSLDEADSQAIKISIRASDKEWQVLVGKEASSGSGFYVRKPGRDQTWLSDQKFDLDENEYAWLNRQLFDFSSDNVRSIKRLDDEQWTIEKTGDSNNRFQLVDRQDSDLRYETVLEAYADVIATLNFDTLMLLDVSFWETLQPVVLLEVDTFSNENYQLAIAESAGRQYLKVTASTNADFWKSWVFEVSPFTKTQLNKFHGDFLVEPEVLESASD